MKNLQKIRKAAGLTQQQLADAAGLNVRMLQYYEQGYKDINAAGALTVYQLAQALGCQVQDLLELDANEQN
jgi:transcriptional regulator with XRE-family HTH domain